MVKSSALTQSKENTMDDRQELNRNLAQMHKGGVIMDVTTPEQAKIAEAAGACAVMALERIPADIRAAGGVSRMSDPAMIKGIQAAVLRPSRSTTSTSRRSSHRPTTSGTSTRRSSPCRSSAARATWVRPCGASARVRR